MAAEAQMNVRMNGGLKLSGDAVLAKYGYKASQVVRALWEYLAVFEKVPDDIQGMIVKASDPGEVAAKGTADEGSALVEAFYENFGLKGPEADGLSYDLMRERAAAEQMTDWGLL